MKTRLRRSVRSTASAALAWSILRLENLGLWLLRITQVRRQREEALREAGTPVRSDAPPQQEQHADERAARRAAEAEHGGLSTEESDARYERGENPGGLHHKAVRREEGPEHPRPEQEEPQERKERVPGGERHLGAVRRGS